MSLIRVLYGLNERRRGAEISTALHVPGRIEDWHVVGATGEPAFQNGHSAMLGVAPTAFRKDPDGFVYLRGGLAAPTDQSNAAWFLPVGYRPPYAVVLTLSYTFHSSPGPNGPYPDRVEKGNLTIVPAGFVHIFGDSFGEATFSSEFPLDGFRFRVRA